MKTEQQPQDMAHKAGLFRALNDMTHLNVWTSGKKLCSLLDVTKYAARRLVNVADFFQNWFAGCVVFECPVNDDEKSKQESIDSKSRFKKSISELMPELKFIGLEQTAIYAERLLDSLSDDSDWSGVFEKIETMKERCDDELSSIFLLHIDNIRFYEKTDLCGDNVKSKFPTANNEITEAGNCFALARFTASVFHLMRSCEVALKSLFPTVRLSLPQRAGDKNWAGMIKLLKAEIPKISSPDDRDYMEKCVAFMEGIKNPLRNDTMHVDSIYDENGAESVFDAVKAFMRHLATKIDEKGTTVFVP